MYGQLFRQADADNVGVITGDVAVKFFEKTRLDSRVLGEVSLYPNIHSQTQTQAGIRSLERGEADNHYFFSSSRAVLDMANRGPGEPGLSHTCRLRHGPAAYRACAGRPRASA